MKGLIMIPTLVKEADELRQVLAGKKKSVDITLSRDTAELVFQVLNAKASGKEILVIKGLKDISPSEAALIMGVSRPQIRKMMDAGVLPFRMVGSHHRIAINDLQNFMTSERDRQEKSMKLLFDFETELGLVD
jgi:excisionase family DNA binding protein